MGWRHVFLVVGTLAAAIFGTVLLYWLWPGVPVNPDTSTQARAICGTILLKSQIDKESYESLDTSRLDSVYINDWRGGLRKELDVKRYSIEMLHAEQEQHLGELRIRQASGTQTCAEKTALADVPDCLPTATSHPSSTPIIMRLKRLEPLQWQRVNAYPGPNLVSTPLITQSLAYPPAEYLPAIRADVYPTPEADRANQVASSSNTPDFCGHTAEQAQGIYVKSIRIKGNLAQVDSNTNIGSYRMVLVRVDGRWYIAGERRLDPQAGMG